MHKLIRLETLTKTFMDYQFPTKKLVTMNGIQSKMQKRKELRTLKNIRPSI